MFGALGAPTSVKRPAEAAAASPADEDSSDIRKLNKLMAKLLLQHEDHIRGDIRDENVVVTVTRDSEFARSLDGAVDEYASKGKVAREQAKDQGQQYKGNPLGKKPDAYLRSLIHFVNALYQKNKEEVLAAAAQGHRAEEARQALDALGRFAQAAKNMEARFPATRCFRIETKENDKEIHKWIFAANSMQELMTSFFVLRENGCMKAASLTLDYDHAPRAKVAKEIEAMVFRGGSSSQGSSKKPKKK